MAHDTKNRLKTRASVLAVASCLAVAPLVADAAGLGRLTVLSMLGQPLQAEIDLTATRDELAGMTAKVASPDAFRLAGIDYAGTLTALRFSIETRPSGQPYVKLVSDRPISEPFVDMLIELSWPAGRLVREYTFLLDPPEMAVGGEAIAAPVEAPQRADVSPAATPVPAEAAAVAVPLAAPAGQPVEAVKPVEPAYGAGPGQVDIKRGDTLGKIANRLRGEGVSLEQMLVALFRENPRAFMGNNMNRMMAGKILTIPSRESVQAIAQDEALREVRAQAADWNAYRSRLAGVVADSAAREPGGKQEVSGRIAAKVEEPAPAVKPGEDQVKVAKTELATGGAPAAKLKEEDRVAKERALRESQQRTTELEKNVADLQKLVEIKSKGMAEVQQQAAAKPEATPPAVAGVKPPAPAAGPAPAPAPAPKVAAEAPKTDAAAAAVAKPPAVSPTQVAPQAAAAPKPKPKAPPPPPPPEPPGFVEELVGNPAVLGGLAALVAAIGGLVFYRRRKSAAAAGGASVLATGTLSQPSLGANSVFRTTGGQAVDTSNVTPATTDFSQAGPGAIDTDEVDPVAEAEVYMAYGRDAQAEEILLEALQKDPKRTAIHAKLLEIYASRKSVKQFETLATELYAQTGGSGPDWEAAAALGVQLDPSNSLYSGGGRGARPDAGAAPAAPAAKPTTTQAMPGSLAQMAGGTVSQMAAAEAGGSVDFDLGSDAGASAADKQIFDFDLGLGGTPTGANPAAGSTNRGTGGQRANPAAMDDALKFDFDVASPGVDTPVDIELTSSLIAPQPMGTAVDLSAINLDLGASKKADAGASDFDKTMFFAPGSQPAASPAATASVDAGIDLLDSNLQAVATKLDLAKAYEEMGDAEGARELLDEVMAEGNDEQQSAAKAILARLG